MLWKITRIFCTKQKVYVPGHTCMVTVDSPVIRHSAFAALHVRQFLAQLAEQLHPFGSGERVESHPLTKLLIELES